MAQLGIIGIGNTLAGDDGAGIVAVKQLQLMFRHRRDLYFHELTGDLFEAAELLTHAKHFLFLDALAGNTPGEIIITTDITKRAFAPSFHQTDIGSVMHSLQELGMANPFPSWEVWGVVIAPPTEFKTELSFVVASAVDLLVKKVCDKINET